MTRKNRLWIQLAALAVALVAAEVAALPRVAARANQLITRDPAAAVVKAGRVLARDLSAFANTHVARMPGLISTQPCPSGRCLRVRRVRTRAVDTMVVPARAARGTASIVVMVLS